MQLNPVCRYSIPHNGPPESTDPRRNFLRSTEAQSLRTKPHNSTTELPSWLSLYASSGVRITRLTNTAAEGPWSPRVRAVRRPYRNRCAGVNAASTCPRSVPSRGLSAHAGRGSAEISPKPPASVVGAPRSPRSRWRRSSAFRDFPEAVGDGRQRSEISPRSFATLVNAPGISRNRWRRSSALQKSPNHVHIGRDSDWGDAHPKS